MILQYCSDLHLEFPTNRLWLERNPIEPVGDILIVAGDTYYLGKKFSELNYWKMLSEQFQEVYVLPGNHEYYGGYDIASHRNEVIEKLHSNVWLVNNTVIEKPDCRLIFTTLWSMIEQHVKQIVSGMNDFRHICFDGQVMGVEQYNQLHQSARTFLTHAIGSDTTKKQIVVTHHLPSGHCNVDEYKGSVLNEAFCVDMTNFIENSGIDAWIYGHSHRNLAPFIIGQTRMLTNQLGYVLYGEHYSFNWNAWIEV